ncbi:SEC-C domain-containing protein [Pendulispora brunnea]|uniref:SEC-C domain-containing protein n=1 Tax=Pendulispora brunnea TaxID=2905690 RepID=A0ABZ2KML8_9BACT
MAHGVPKTFTLEIIPERATDVRRVVEVLQHSTLEELHMLIQREFRLDNDHHYSFFMTNRAWDHKGEFGSNAGDPTRTQLASLNLKPGRQFLYLFDFGDELRHAITVKDTGTVASDVEYPRVVESAGWPPPQYESDDAPELDEDLVPLAEEVAEAASEFEGDDDENPEDLETADVGPRDLAIVQRDAALARRLIAALQGREDQIMAIARECEVFADEWLESVPFQLAEHGLMDEAVELSTMLAGVFPQREYLLGDRALVLARAGRRDEARQLMAALRASHPDDLDVMDQAADVLVALGEDAEAEALSREVRARAEDTSDGESIVTSTERIIDLLRKRGEEGEAQELEEELVELVEHGIPIRDDEDDEFEESLDADGGIFAEPPPREPLPTGPDGVLRTGPKVGRNDPCPCGSGKKYKKCCLA